MASTILNFKDFLSERQSNPCWKGYKQIGTKKKGNKIVPNCVKIEESMPYFDRTGYYLDYFSNLCPQGFSLKRDNSDIIISVPNSSNQFQTPYFPD